MATRINFGTIATPIVSVPAEASGDNSAVDTISYEVGKSVGGQGNVNVDLATVVGFNNGSVVYFQATTAVAYPFADTAVFKFLHIKHTGYKYSSSSVLGAASTDNLLIYLKITSTFSGLAGNTEANIIKLQPGESVAIPVGADLDFSADGVDVGWKASANTIAVEVMATT